MSLRQRISALACLVAAIAVTIGLAGCGSTAPQQKYPTRDLTLLIGWAPGASLDQAGRALAEATQKHFGQPIVPQNVAGAGGGIALAQLAQAKPDGYTIVITAAGVVTQPHLEDVTYKPLEDFIPFMQVAGYPVVYVVRADSPYKTLKDLVDYGKANPGKIRFGASGIGSTIHLTGELFARAAGIQITNVPFNSAAEGVAGVIGGNLDAAADSPGTIVAHLQEGRLRALAISTPERYKLLPNIPTFKEQGYAVDGFWWWDLAAPKGTPDSVIQTLDAAFQKGMKDEPFTTWIEKTRNAVVYLGRQENEKKWKADYERLGAILKELKRK